MNGVISPQHEGPLVYFDFATYYGGSFTATVQLIRELIRLTDVEVIDVYGTCEPYITDLMSIGVNPNVLFPCWSGRSTIGGRNGIQRLARLASSIPHIVEVVSRLREALLDIQPRAVWVDQEKALFASWLAVPRDIPLVVHVPITLQQIKPYCALAWYRADAAIGVSESSLQYLRSTGYAHGNIQVVLYGVDVDNMLEKARSEPDRLPSNKSEELKLVLPAYLFPTKGHEFGIRAVAKFIELGGQANLWICGDVPPGASPEFYNNMRRLTYDLNIEEHVHFLGYRADILSVMARSDIVFLPTSHIEGIPRSLMEAMALMKPIVATRVGGIPELVRDGTDGVLVDPNDVDGVVKALRLLSDPDIRDRIGRSGQHRVRENFSLSREARQFLSTIDTLVERPRSEYVNS